MSDESRETVPYLRKDRKSVRRQTITGQIAIEGPVLYHENYTEGIIHPGLSSPVRLGKEPKSITNKNIIINFLRVKIHQCEMIKVNGLFTSNLTTHNTQGRKDNLQLKLPVFE